MVTGISRICRVNKGPQWLREEAYVDFPGFSRTGIEIRFFSPGFSLELEFKAHRIKWLAGLKSTEIWGRGWHLHTRQTKPQLGIIMSPHNVKLEVLNHMNGWHQIKATIIQHSCTITRKSQLVTESSRVTMEYEIQILVRPNLTITFVSQIRYRTF